MSIKFEKVEQYYSKDTPFSLHALKSIDIEIKKHSFTAIIGHTGSGKSTLIQHINGLLLPTSGEVIVDEFVITNNKKNRNLKQLRKKAGLVFQFPEYQLFEDTIEKDIMFGPLNFGTSIDEAEKIALEMINLVGLDKSYLQKSPFELSGGQKRRVAIAGILAMNPDILVLDEPTAGLDPQGTKQMMELFQKIHKLNKTIILVTHDMNHVLSYCDDVIVMNKGKVELHDKVSEIFKDESYLTNKGIELPLITKTILSLNKEGFNIDVGIKDIEELVKSIREEIHG